MIKFTGGPYGNQIPLKNGTIRRSEVEKEKIELLRNHPDTKSYGKKVTKENQEEYGTPNGGIYGSEAKPKFKFNA